MLILSCPGEILYFAEKLLDILLENSVFKSSKLEEKVYLPHIMIPYFDYSFIIYIIFLRYYILR